MSGRSILYWLICSALAALAAQSAEPGISAEFLPPWSAPADSTALLPVPEPTRAIMLFAGIMAMAFTYRRAWLNWKSGREA